MAKPRLKSLPKPPPPTQREQDQADTINALRLILGVLTVRHGVMNTIRISPKEIEAMKNGSIRVVDDPQGNIMIGVKIDPGLLPGPKLVVER